MFLKANTDFAEQLQPSRWLMCHTLIKNTVMMYEEERLRIKQTKT